MGQGIRRLESRRGRLKARSTVVILLLSTVLLRAQDDQQRLAEAAGLARQHRFAEAEQVIEGVKAPGDPSREIAFHRLRAAVDAGLKRPKESAEEMHAALRLSPGDPGLLEATAVADLVWLDTQLKTLPNGRGSVPGDSHPDLAETVATLRGPEAKALPETGDVEALLGEAYEALGDNVSSARSFQEAVRLSPNEERFRIALAIELMRHQTFEPALAILRQSIIDFPQSARARTAFALTLFLSGKEQEGTAQLLQAISLDRTFAPAIHYLGEITLSQAEVPEQRVVKAECDYADAHLSDAMSNAYCGALQARVASKETQAPDWAPIVRRLASASARSPNNALARCEYGRALDQAHDWGRARSELQACVRLDPDSIEGHYRLARIYERLGERNLARRELAKRVTARDKMAASNEAREESVKRFLYTMSER